ncbi:MAG: amino acid adenylation domain-containing protein [Clostridia bacterium]|nr:amino acid adenylation domain-containing protein [Clostridia bacterium]
MDGTSIRCRCGADSADSARGIAEKLAYVVYTSGSTGEPKGVEITQKNLLNLSQEMRSVYGQGAVLSVCNVGFDAFMLESIVALLNGRTIVLPLDSDLESPESLASLMNGYAVGFFSMTPSRLSALLRSDVFRKVMWRMESIICGGEHFPPELLKKLKACTQAKIYNQYGPSEATVAVSMKELSASDKITVGSPMGNCKLYVLDQWMNPLPIGGSGRLYVGGTCVGRGYRNRPELTEKAFRNNPFISDDRIYDTGDLAYWTAHGEVVLTGRADRQVKLRGLRIELQEIASCLESHPLIIAAFAKICELNGQKVIGAYYTSDLEVSEAELLSHAATYLPEYMIPTFILLVTEFATTANGKIDESRLPVPVSDNRFDGEVSETALRVIEIFREVLSNDSVHGASDYFLSGGNSLNALECILRIEEAFGKKIRVADLYACRNAVRVAQMIDGNAVKAYATTQQGRSAFLVKRDAVRAEYPLTPIQQGIYVQSMLDPSGLSYNMPGAFLLEKEPDFDRLTAAFASLVESDPIFRTSFVQGLDGICARIAPSVAFEVEILTADTYEHACEEFLRPFDLSNAPLLRAAIWKSEDEKHYLFLDSHHIVGDGLSTPIILRRLDQAYSGMNTPVKWDFYDYVHTVTENADNESKKDLSYWVSHLKDLPDPLVLPSDFVRPKNFDFKGNDIEYVFTEQGSALYGQYCKEHGISEFVLFLAAYGLLLSSVTGSNDLIIGTPVAGRNHVQSSEVCGPFINTLPLRLTPKSDLTVSEWLDSVKNEVANLLDHQNVSLEEIISALDLPRGEMNALYRVMLTQSPVDESAFALGGDKMSFRPIATGIVKMDLILELAKRNSRYALKFSYANSVFEAETIEFYGRCMEQAVKMLVKQSDSKLGNISLLSAVDKERYVETPNYSVTPFVNRPVHHLLRNRSLSDPDQTAVIFHGTPYSYSYIERRACFIASFLEEKGIQVGQCVGLCLHRTQDMIAAMYGVLKAGCSYMFMLDSFPEARLQYMAEISRAAAILYDDPKQNLLNADLPCDTFELPEGECDSYEDRPVKDNDLVNVLFTSGSTGKPKGVMLRHRSISNLYSQMKTLLDPIEGNVLCSTNTVFDCFVVETIIALALGRTVVLADEEEMMLPWKLAELMEAHDTGIFEMTPSRLQMCLGNEAFCKAAKHINIVLLGGEVVTRTLRDKFYQYSNGILMNMYGPTEATVFTTMGHVKPNEHITIGAPLQNTRTYVLDQNLRPVLPTAYGELYIAGECLSAGYVSRPDITEESFVDDIYFPGQKMYRSGDIVRQRLDGRFDYFGRKDAQVKLNGQRVELTEINGAIEQTGFVKQAATVTVRKEDGSMELCTYYVPSDDSVTDERILSAIASVLPKYMIPSRMVALSDMPLTATNKVDMQTLIQWASTPSAAPVENRRETPLKTQEAPSPEKEYSLFEEAEDAEAPESSSEEDDGSRIPDVDYVLSVWNKVLSVPVTNAEESFFKLGGTSMSALNVLSIYYNDGFEMSLSDFYQATTASAQAELLCEVSGISEQKEAPVPPVIASQKNGVLITGATGFFGIHLLKELAAREEGKIVCILRDGNTARMARYLAWYFNEDVAGEIINRIEIVKGDVSDPHLGLTASEYERLVASVHTVYHCAADVRHFTADTDAYLKTNVGGTENMLTFAKRAGASFYHMSTCSVSGDSLKDDRENAEFSENDYDIGQNWEDNIYVKSKFMAEGLVRRAIDEGLNAKIFRLGRLVGRAEDGKFQINPESNAFYLFLRGIAQLGSISRRAARTRIELTPIDLCVNRVLALRDASGTVYHIMNENPPTMAEILNVVCPDCRIVTAVDFAKAIKAKSKTPEGKLLPFVLSNLQMTGPRRDAIRVSNRLTEDALKAAGYAEAEYKLETILKDFEIEE